MDDDKMGVVRTGEQGLFEKRRGKACREAHENTTAIWERHGLEDG